MLISKFAFLFLNILLVPRVSYAEAQCIQIFHQELSIFQDHPIIDHRQLLDGKPPGHLQKIGEGNSGEVFIFKSSSGEFKVAKIYKPERQENLERDHKGLREVQEFFQFNASHSPLLKVAKSEIVMDFNSVRGQSALVMPYYPGINLHELLISLPSTHPQRQQAEQLYNGLIKELDTIAKQMKIGEEVKPEHVLYFRDHLLDGLSMLEIRGKPTLLIKTDNIIFNPDDGSLTLVDPK